MFFFSAFCLHFFVLAAFGIDLDSSYPASAQIESATKLARCRAHCIDAFEDRFPKIDSLTNDRCMADTDCWMCWDYCEMFNTNFDHWGNMCNQKTLCFDGCRLACAVFAADTDSDSTAPLDLYHGDNSWSFPSAPILESDAAAGWLRLRWSNIVPLSTIIPPLPNVLYVLFWRSGGPWLQLEQTLSTVYETRHGDIVIGGRSARFLILAVTRDGLVTVAKPRDDRMTTASEIIATTISPLPLSGGDEKNYKAKVQFVLAIVGASLLTGLLVSVGLVCLHRMIQSQRRRHSLVRTNAIRFRPRQRQTSASSRLALIQNLNPAKLESSSSLPITDRDRKSINRGRFEDLFKGTIFESPPPFQGVTTNGADVQPPPRFRFDATFSFDV